MRIKKNIWLMYAVSLLGGMIFYGPIATLYRQAAGLNIFQITLIESISMALCLALELPCGMLADRIGYKNMMVGCSFLYFASKIVFWQAGGFGMFLTERIMLSVVMASLSGLDTSILYLSCGSGEAQSVFGTYNNLGTAGLIIAAGVYSLFIGEDYRLAGLLTVISYGIMALLTLFLDDVKPPERERSSQGREFACIFKSVAKDRKFLLFILSVALLNETHQTVTVFLNQLQYVKCGLTDREIGLIYIGVTVAGLTGGFSARITGKIGERRFGALLFAVCAAACAALALTVSPVLSVLAIVALRIGFSLFQPLHTEMQNRKVSTSDRATALSINAVIMESAGVLTNLVFGAAARTDVSRAMALGAVLCAAGLGMFLPGSRAVPSKTGEE